MNNRLSPAAVFSLYTMFLIDSETFTALFGDYVVANETFKTLHQYYIQEYIINVSYAHHNRKKHQLAPRMTLVDIGMAMPRTLQLLEKFLIRKTK